METTETTQQRIRRFADYLDNSDNVTTFSTYYLKDANNYNYSITGFLDGIYFDINLYSWDEKDYAKLSSNTDCPNEIEEILNIFLLPITERD